MDSAPAAEEPTDTIEQLREWSRRLSVLRESLGGSEGTAAADFCESALEELMAHVTSSPPRRGTAANVVVMDVINVTMGLLARSVIDDSLSRDDALLTLTAAIGRAVGEADGWIVGGNPADSEISRRFEAASAGMKQSEDDLAAAAAAQKAEYDRASKHGAVLGYTDPTVDTKVIYTQVCAFSEEEHGRYSAAYERLKRMLDRDLLRYVQDSVTVFTGFREQTLASLEDSSFPTHNPDRNDEFAHRIRSAALTASNAFHIHQMQTYWAAKDAFGKPSPEYDKLTDLFHDLYSECHGYRWLLELRHTMLHISMEAVSLQIKVTVDHEPIVNVMMDRSWMKESSGVMGKAYKRTELLAMPADPSVVTMIEEALPAMTAVQDEIDKVLYPGVAEDAATVRELISRFEGRRGTYALQTGPGFTRRLRIPPMRQLTPRILAFADKYPLDATTS